MRGKRPIFLGYKAHHKTGFPWGQRIDAIFNIDSIIRSSPKIKNIFPIKINKLFFCLFFDHFNEPPHFWAENANTQTLSTNLSTALVESFFLALLLDLRGEKKNQETQNES